MYLSFPTIYNSFRFIFNEHGLLCQYMIMPTCLNRTTYSFQECKESKPLVENYWSGEKEGGDKEGMGLEGLEKHMVLLPLSPL